VPRLARPAAHGLVILALLTIGFAAPASAKSHLWRFKEIFSNADGTIQYIEMDVTDPTGTEEIHTSGQPLTSNGSVFIVPNPLPNENTYLRSILFGTAAFAALPGAPTPDWIIPENFFDPAGDELRWRTLHDIYSFTSNDLPTDGIHALQRSDGSQPINTPQNFAWETGTVDASPPGVGMGAEPVWIGIVVTMLAISAVATLGYRHRNA